MERIWNEAGFEVRAQSLLTDRSK